MKLEMMYWKGVGDQIEKAELEIKSTQFRMAPFTQLKPIIAEKDTPVERADLLPALKGEAFSCKSWKTLLCIYKEIKVVAKESNSFPLWYDEVSIRCSIGYCAAQDKQSQRGEGD